MELGIEEMRILNWIWINSKSIL